MKLTNDISIRNRIKYTKGNVKLRDRCVTKARIDYNDRN